MELTITVARIDKVFKYAKEARNILFFAVKNEHIAKAQYERGRNTLLILGVEGKNADQRNANLDHELAPLKENLGTASSHVRRAKAEYDTALLEIDRVNATLRYWELPNNPNTLTVMGVQEEVKIR